MIIFRHNFMKYNLLQSTKMPFDLSTAKSVPFLFLLFIFLLPLTHTSQAQTPGLKIVPIPHKIEKPGKQVQNLRTQAAGDTISLPFWDDFSQVQQDNNGETAYFPDTAKWMPSGQDVLINFTSGINPPTLGVATFDGVNAFGIPHNPGNPDATGLADSLLSRPINMGAVPESERNSVFFSFFWQFKGLGEFPDEEDSLRLQFKNNEGEWITQWSQGGNLEITDEFVQEIFPVNDEAYFYNGFQFRFQSFGRLSADFDVWHVDYVFLNYNRTPGNTVYLDRGALTRLPTSIFKDFTAIPINQFKTNPAKFIDSTTSEVINLETADLEQNTPYTSLIRNKFSREIIEIMDDTVNLFVKGQRREIIVASPIDYTLLNLDIDSIYLETEINVNSGDEFLIKDASSTDTTFFESVNYRVNDTARATSVLHDYYAYDDGSAEVGAGVNQNSGKLAYRFIVEEPDTLTHIDIYFPITASQNSVPITLFVWRDLDKEGEEVILTEAEFTVRKPARINEFSSYQLPSAIVNDTFYIGYQQSTTDFLAVGLDKNTNSGDKIYFNVTGSWQKNEEIQGSLMMRPRFENDAIVGIEDELPPLPDDRKSFSLTVYPNPNTGQFQVKGAFTDLVIRDILGKKIAYTHTKINTGLHEIFLNTPRPGIYLVSFTTKFGVESYKVLVR